jgi:hypothetical protein
VGDALASRGRGWRRQGLFCSVRLGRNHPPPVGRQNGGFDAGAESSCFIRFARRPQAAERNGAEMPGKMGVGDVSDRAWQPIIRKPRSRRESKDVSSACPGICFAAAAIRHRLRADVQRLSHGCKSVVSAVMGD